MQYFIQFSVHLYGNQVQHLCSGQVAITFPCQGSAALQSSTQPFHRETKAEQPIVTDSA